MDEWPEDLIRQKLGQKEQMLWRGRPDQGLLLRPADALLIPFSITWGGFAFFWKATVIAGGAPIFFALWGIPFVLMGLSIMIGRFWIDARQRSAKVYGVTSKLIVMVSGMFSRSVKSLSFDTLRDVFLLERAGRGGTITFGSVPFLHCWYAGAGWTGKQCRASKIPKAQERCTRLSTVQSGLLKGIPDPFVVFGQRVQVSPHPE